MRSSEFRTRKTIAYVLSFTGIFIDAFYLILFFIPVFFRRVYVYPIPDGSDRPSSVWESNSILTATLKNGNPIGILTFVFCVADLLLLLIFTDCASAEENRFKTGICFRVAARHRCFSDFSDDCTIGVVCFVGRCGF